MDLGEEKPAIVIEPIKVPVPGVESEPAPAEPEWEPEPEMVPEEEPVPA